MLTKLTAGAAALALAGSVLVTTPADARSWNRGGAFLGGLAAGAIIGGAIASRPYYYGPGYYAPPVYAPPIYAAPPVYAGPPVYDDSVTYCMQRFRSYDPASGTYLGYDGLRHPCP